MNSSSPRHSMRHSLVSDEAPRVAAMKSLSLTSHQLVGVATIIATELVAIPVLNAAAIDSAARVGPRLPAGERILA